MNKRATQYDVAVVGAGVFGVWCSYFLQSAGYRVLLIDAYGAGNSRSSSGGETRIIRMGYGADEVYSRWASRSLAHWKELSAHAGEDLFLRTGMLWLARDNDDHTRASEQTLKTLGVPFQRLERNELEGRYPQFSFGPISWALYEPESGVILARRAVQILAREAIAKGVDYLQAAVIPPNGKTRLEELSTTTEISITAQEFVFACGAWLPKVFPELLVDVIHPTRQEVFFFGLPGGTTDFKMPAMPAWIDFKAQAYGLPDIENRGFKMALDRHGPAIDPDEDERLIAADTLGLVRAQLAELFPALKHAPLIETRVCQYENTSSGDFLVDRHPELENVWLVGGGSGHGFKHGPALGEYVASLLKGDGIAESRFALARKTKRLERSIF